MHCAADATTFHRRAGGCGRGGFDLFDLLRAMTVPRSGPGRGFGPWWGATPGAPWGGGRRGPKARRGDVRTAALLLLAEEPRNGYQIMQELEERSHGAWRPSPGSVYPALQQLEDEGLVRSTEEDGRRLYALTDAGRRLVEQRGADRSAPWEELADGVSEDAWALLRTAREVGVAMMQVLQTGTDAQRAEAQRILADARRRLYRLLADGDDDGDARDDAGRR